MFEVIWIDDFMAQKIIKEYEEVIDTIDPYFSPIMPYAYVPRVEDMAGAYENLTEDSFLEIYKVFNDYNLFYKLGRQFINCPLKEVW
jgi:hypothetical protein